jgi:hypothetical protein
MLTLMALILVQMADIREVLTQRPPLPAEVLEPLVAAGAKSGFGIDDVFCHINLAFQESISQEEAAKMFSLNLDRYVAMCSIILAPESTEPEGI